MALFDLRSQGARNIQTDFRYELIFPSISSLGLSDSLSVYCTSASLPKASQSFLAWFMQFGKKNHQAGKRETEEIQLEFVVPTGTGTAINIFNMFQLWLNSTFDLNTGYNTGKGNYAVDGVKIVLHNELGVAEHTFELLKAFPTQVDYGTVKSESNDLFKVTMNLIYDDYKHNRNSYL